MLILGGEEASVTFGFSLGDLLYSPSLISGGNLGAVSELTLDPTVATSFFAGVTLEDSGVADFEEGALLFTANTTNDTIVFSASPVPEPTSGILCCLAGLSLLHRRR